MENAAGLFCDEELIRTQRSYQSLSDWYMIQQSCQSFRLVKSRNLPLPKPCGCQHPPLLSGHKLGPTFVFVTVMWQDNHYNGHRDFALVCSESLWKACLIEVHSLIVFLIISIKKTILPGWWDVTEVYVYFLLCVSHGKIFLYSCP